jgi:hypothetical protein
MAWRSYTGVLVGIVPLPKNAADQIGGAPPPQVVTLIKKPVGCKSLSSVESVSAAITFNSRHLSTCGWTRALFRPRRVCGREAADYAGACHPPAPKFAALIFHVLLELP